MSGVSGAPAQRTTWAPVWKCRIALAGYQPPRPAFLGTKVFDDYSLGELARYIDWSPFFATWELKGHYPAILDDPAKGTEARQLMNDAEALLERIVREKLLRARAVIGLFPANISSSFSAVTGATRASSIIQILLSVNVD